MLVYNTLASCDKCASPNIIQGQGSIFTRIVFVYDYPDTDPKSVEIFDKLLKFLAIERKNIYVTSLVKCAVKDYKIAENCSGYLLQELILIEPEIIVALGALPFKFLTGLEGIIDNNANFFEPIHKELKHVINPKTIFAMIHPGYLLRNPDAKKLFLFAGKILKEALMAFGDDIPF